MIELQDNRVLGAIRWIDAITQAPISLPLLARSPQLQFNRNLTGLTIITVAAGLEHYISTFNLDDLSDDDIVALGSQEFEGIVQDPSGTYLPARFALVLPRDASPTLLPPDNRRPPNSLFTPIDVALLPSPNARLAPGCAQVRVLIQDGAGNPIRNALARIVATNDETVLGCGLADARGEALIGIPGLKHFAPGATAEEVVSIETEARLEIIHPPATADVVDWTELRDAIAADGDTDPLLLRLRPGALFSRRYPFAT